MIYSSQQRAAHWAAILNSRPGYAPAWVCLVPEGWTIISSYRRPETTVDLALGTGWIITEEKARCWIDAAIEKAGL